MDSGRNLKINLLFLKKYVWVFTTQKAHGITCPRITCFSATESAISFENISTLVGKHTHTHQLNYFFCVKKEFFCLYLCVCFKSVHIRRLQVLPNLQVILRLLEMDGTAKLSTRL